MTAPRTGLPGEPGCIAPGKHAPIAIVGIGCVFPGAVGAHAFWSLLTQGLCSVGPVPAERWDPSALPASAAAFAGFIDDADCFDAAFFGISPKEACALDPRQRLALQVAWWALEDAGIAPDGLKGSDLGVFMGATNGEYAGLFENTDVIEPHMGVGMSNAVIANRISHVLGAHGPSMAVDTACSASLVAVHLACRSLQTGDCSVALAGGVSLMLRADSMVGLGKAGMLAPDGRCKSFDAAADGYGRGEGCGLIVLKRLNDAVAAGDRIHAVIRGSAINHDGISNGITAPNGLSQEGLIKAALADAGVAPAAIGYVEAHGTGTLLGDPTEARALGHTLGRRTDRASPLLLGSVKTNIGHLEAAAGVAGLIKLVLAVQHGQIPASLHYTKPNPHIDFDALGLKVVDTPAAWPASENPRIGAVSSFGFGGANAHVVVEQAERRQAGTIEKPELLLLSATSADSLASLVGDCVAALENDSGQSWPAIAALSQIGRSHLRHRLAVVANDVAGACRALADFQAQRGSADAVAAVAARRAPKLALLCPGQGAHRPGMAGGLLMHDDQFRAAIAHADDVLGWSLSDLLRNASQEIDHTAFTQPALLAIGVALARTLAAHGIEPVALSGHSLGEYTAAVIAGGIDYADALRLVAARGRLMSEAPANGAMAAVFASEEQVLPFLTGKVALAAVNGPQSVTISGERNELARVVSALEAAGIRIRLLRVSTAFHSPLLEPMLEPFGKIAGAISWHPLRIPVVSNLNGELLPAGHVYDADYWVRHTRDPVRFSDGVRALESLGIDTALELGTLPVLTGLLHENASKIRAMPVLSSPTDDRNALLRTVGALHVNGARIDWQAARHDAAAGDCLPRYPFAKDRYPLRIGGAGLAAPTASGQTTAQVPPLAAAATAPATATMRPARNQPAIRERVIGLVASLLSIDPAQVDPSAPFLELGADSLILIQAVGRIETEFQVKIPVRAFFEDLSTIDAVCAYLVRAQPSSPAAAASAATPPPQAAQSAEPTITARPPQNAPPASATGLDEAQRRHLDDLTAAYIKRTGRSRAYAQRFRPVMADSRGSAGFRFSIKEMLYPIVGQRGAGSKIWDLDDNEYIDISMGFGVQLFGHEPEFLREAMSESLTRGIRIGPQSDAAGEVAELIAELTGVERVAFCNTGTEAVMTALRLARTASGRTRIAVFRNSYHGHFDGVLGETHSDPWSVFPRAPGITTGMVADLALFEYGSADSLEQLKSRIGEFAAVLVEPVQSRNPGLQPAAFLHALRAITQTAGTILIFDEVLTGFRIHPGGAQAHFGVQADLATYGKIVGGGLPIGVVAGRCDIMAGIDGGVWQYGDASFPASEATFFAGTFNKHPLVMAAARAVLTEIKRAGPGDYTVLNRRTADLAERLDHVFASAGAPIRMSRFGSLFRFVFNENLDPFFYHLIHRGLYVWEGRNLFLSTAHTEQDVTAIVERVADSVSILHSSGFITHKPAQAPIAPSPPVELPLSQAQRQLATLAALSSEGSAAYAVAVALEFNGPLDVARLSGGLDALVCRHDALRASIDLDAGVQRIASRAPFALQRQTAHGRHAAELDEMLRNDVARPFDLSRPPALRATLFDLGPEQAVLLIAVHHALVDGQSLQLLLEELASLYGSEKLLPPPSYAMLAQRMARAGTAPEDEAHRTFWRQTLDAAPAGIELPFAHIRPPMRRYAGARVAIDIDPASVRTLEQNAGKRGLSSTMALIAAFAATLRRCGAQRDMVLGVPFSGHHPGLERTIGYRAHLLPLRLQLAATACVADVMLEVRRQFLDAIEHADYPMACIIDDLKIARDPARPPLVNATFNVDRMAALPTLGGLRVAPRSAPIAFSRFEIGCNVLDWGNGIRIEIDYDSDLFDGSDIRSMLDAFIAMIDRFGADAPIPFDERTELRGRWLAPSAQPRGPGLLARFRQGALALPSACAVEVDGRAAIDRKTLDGWSDHIADAVAASAHGPGPVALLIGRTAAMPAAMLAVWKTGRAYLPIDADLPASRIAQLLHEAAPCCVLLDPDLAVNSDRTTAGLAAAVVPIPPIPSDQSRSEPRPFTEPAAETTAYMLFTSGSTGTPKLVAVPHRAVTHYLDGIVDGLALKPGLRYAVVSTFAADLGLTAVLPALFHGGCLVIVGAALARNADAFAATMRNAPVDVLKIVPSHLDALLSATDRQAILPRTHLVLGGETAGAGLLAALSRIDRSCRVFNHFGPTEATVGVMIGEWDGSSPLIRFQRPIGNATIAVLDAGGQLCGIDETGEVTIAGPSLASGYVGQATHAEASFATLDIGRGPERMYLSGDLGRVRGDGSIELSGRKDDQIKIRGYRIEPAEISAAIMLDPEVGSAVVVQRMNDAGRACLVAYAVPGSGENAIDTARIMDRLKHTLPAAMTPTAIVVLDALPLTTNGKLDHARLPAPAALTTATTAGNDKAPADSELLALLLDLWRKLLGRPDIGMQHDFFQSGGDSILSIQLIAKLHQAGWRVKAADLYAHPTLAAFAARIRPAVATNAAVAHSECALLPSQLRLIERFGDLPPHFNLSVGLALSPWVTPAMLEAALTALIEHHDALRLCFSRDGDAWSAKSGSAYRPDITAIETNDDRALHLSAMQSSLDPAQGRLLAAAWIEASGQAPAGLVIAIHHLVCDGVSLQILLEDLRQALLDLHAGRAPALGARTTSIHEWADLLRRLARQDDIAAEADYWELVSSLPAPDWPRLPAAADHAVHSGAAADQPSETVSLTHAQTALLIRRIPGTAAGVEDILIAAATLAFAQRSGEALAYIELEGHGRESERGGHDDIHLGRTVGWFTSRYPAWFDLTGIAPAEAAEAIAEQRRAIPGKGLGYGLLKHFGPDPVRANLALGVAPEISLNYLGQISPPPADAFTVISWLPDRSDRGPERAAALPQLHRIAIEAAVADGCLNVIWQFNPRVHSRAEIVELANSFLRHAVALCAIRQEKADGVEARAAAPASEALELKT